MTKISTVKSNGRLKVSEHTVCGRTKDIEDASLVFIPSVCQSRRAKLPLVLKQESGGPVMVPVLSDTGKPLMPCSPARARHLLRKGKAIKRWYRGIFAIKLLTHCKTFFTQPVAVGIDPGSKREAFTVVSEKRTFLNVLSDSVSWVSLRIKIRKLLRRGRRFRKTPCRKIINNRRYPIGRIIPSVKARQQIRINVLKFLVKLFPIAYIAYEDTKAVTFKNKKKWNRCFSHIQDGKNWLFENLYEFGIEVKIIDSATVVRNRTMLGLRKSRNPMSFSFEAHNVDSWILANYSIGSPQKDSNYKGIYRIVPIQFHRRQLHVVDPKKDNFRKRYGGTISLGFKRGSVVLHKKHGISYIGGNYGGNLCIRNMVTGKIISHRVKKCDVSLLYVSPWRSFVMKK